MGNFEIATMSIFSKNPRPKADFRVTIGSMSATDARIVPFHCDIQYEEQFACLQTCFLCFRWSTTRVWLRSASPTPTPAPWSRTTSRTCWTCATWASSFPSATTPCRICRLPTGGAHSTPCGRETPYPEQYSSAGQCTGSSSPLLVNLVKTVSFQTKKEIFELCVQSPHDRKGILQTYMGTNENYIFDIMFLFARQPCIFWGRCTQEMIWQRKDFQRRTNTLERRHVFSAVLTSVHGFEIHEASEKHIFYVFGREIVRAEHLHLLQWQTHSVPALISCENSSLKKTVIRSILVRPWMFLICFYTFEFDLRCAVFDWVSPTHPPHKLLKLVLASVRFVEVTLYKRSQMLPVEKQHFVTVSWVDTAGSILLL